jgi:ketosteroid isomerase-like protein
MSTLAACRALIIDLRDCPGGSADLVSFLASYFFDPEPRVLMNRYFRPTGERVASMTVADVPGKRMPETDLYILTSPRTASAGESFAYTLQQYGRAKVVGETTAGAGYNNAIIPLGKGFVFSVSYGRPEHPRSGKGWEAVGVQPDVKVEANDALEAAQNLATQQPSPTRVLTSGPEEQVRRLERLWLDAYEQRDAAAMEEILADEFVITHPDGRTQNKAQIVEMMKKMRERSGAPTSKFSTENVQARVAGDTVTLSGRLVQKSERGGSTMTMEFAYTDTYAKRGERWQVIRSELKRLDR